MNEVEEITLYELVLIIAKGWELILISVLITLGLAIGLYFSNNIPTYTSILTGTVLYNKDQITDIGQVTFPYSKSEDFALILNDKEFIDFLSNKMNVDVNLISSTLKISAPNTNDIIINYSSTNKDFSYSLLNKIELYSEKYINYVASSNALKQVNNLQNLKKYNFDKQLIEKNRLIDYLNTEITNTDKYLGNNINPTYSSLLNYKARLDFEKREIEFALNDINETSLKIDELYLKNKSFQSYLSSPQDIKISSIDINFEKMYTTESYRFNAKTLFLLSIILGGMFGVFIVFFRNYWISNSYKKNL